MKERIKKRVVGTSIEPLVRALAGLLRLTSSSQRVSELNVRARKGITYA